MFVLVAVLSYSRRLFVKPFLNERQDDWREGIAAAFAHFGGVPRTVLGDNARALVLGRDRTTGTVVFHPAYLAFCRDWDVQPRACAPYRARTKGKTEAGVKYVKRNGLADLAFASFAALERHLAECKPCRDLVSETERLNALIALDARTMIAPRLPEGFEEAVLSRTVYPQTYKFRQRRRMWTTYVGWTAAAACMAATSSRSSISSVRCRSSGRVSPPIRIR